MRFFIAAALLVVCASPAAAQRLDATRSQGGIDDGRAYCRFRAYPGLRLTHALDGSQRMAALDVQARESNYAAERYAEMVVIFVLSPEGDRLVTAVPQISIMNARQPFARPVASARLLADGEDSQIPVRVEGTQRMSPGSKTTLRLNLAREQSIALGARLLAARVGQVDLLDDTNTVIRSYHWDVLRLREIPRVLDLAQWKCGDAVNR